jgi:hypothetical protein
MSEEIVVILEGQPPDVTVTLSLENKDLLENRDLLEKPDPSEILDLQENQVNQDHPVKRVRIQQYPVL